MFVSLSICLSQRHLKTIEKLRDKKISSIYKNLSFVAITVVNKPNSTSNINRTIGIVGKFQWRRKIRQRATNRKIFQSLPYIPLCTHCCCALCALNFFGNNKFRLTLDSLDYRLFPCSEHTMVQIIYSAAAHIDDCIRESISSANM